jgi:4-hydroxy-tetrahydrodipicolinate reductase
MGKAIASLLEARGHRVAGILHSANANLLDQPLSYPVDVAIEFTSPQAAPVLVPKLLALGIPTVTGSTGWAEGLQQAATIANQKGLRLLWGSNFSVGVNVLFRLNSVLAKWMNGLPQYDVFMEERHHRHKQDSPSGTAVTLAESLLAGLDRKSRYVLTDAYQHNAPAPEDLTLGVIRAGEIPGTHRVVYHTAVDQITIEHQAFGRDGFALGSILAAEWLAQAPPGYYEFDKIFWQMLGEEPTA